MEKLSKFILAYAVGLIISANAQEPDSSTLSGGEQISISQFEKESRNRNFESDAVLKAADKNGDRIVSSQEMNDFFANRIEAVEEKIEEDKAELLANLNNGKPAGDRTYRASDVEPFLPDLSEKPIKVDFFDTLRFAQLRGSLADIDRQRYKFLPFNKDDLAMYLENLSKASPAIFGYSNNDISSNDIWQAQGILGFPFGDFGGESSWSILPSAEFHRVSNTRAADMDIDSLIFRGEASLLSGYNTTTISRLEFRLMAEYGTNFDLDDGVFGGAFEVDPTFGVLFLANGFSRPLPGGLFRYRTRNFLRLEGGSSTGDSIATDDYLRIGPSVGLEIFPNEDVATARYKLFANYSYLADTLDSVNYDRLSTGLTIYLDKNGHASLSAKYDNGLIPLTLQDIRLFSINLGFKF